MKSAQSKIVQGSALRQTFGRKSILVAGKPVPTLGAGEIVMMDNHNSRKVAGVREAIEARGATLVYLPPYSPDFNPIELVFAKFKWLL